MSGGPPGAAEIIAALGLQPHPEGGHFRETFRDEVPGERPHSTAIYYLLQAGERSHWHRVVDAAEVWHFHAGAPLRLRRWDGAGRVEEVLLGADLLGGHHPQAVIEAGVWQAAESTGAYTLVSCTVAPGFQFKAFELAPPGWAPTQSNP